jgi:hypothetical protein
MRRGALHQQRPLRTQWQPPEVRMREQSVQRGIIVPHPV